MIYNNMERSGYESAENQETEVVDVEKNMRLQELHTASSWDESIGLIIQKLDTDPGYEKQFLEFLEKNDRSTHDLEFKPGCWTKMMFEMVENKATRAIIQSYLGSEQLDIVREGWSLEKEGAYVSSWKDLPVDQKILHEHEAELLLLQRMLYVTKRHFRYAPANRYPNEHEILTAAWSDILAEFKKARVESAKARLEKSFGEIKEIKHKVIGFNETLSPEARKRIVEAMVIFGDEYVEYDTQMQYAKGAYMYKDNLPIVRISGRNSVDSAGSRKTIGHELHHVRSGHGQMKDVNDIDLAKNPHLLYAGRVGLYYRGDMTTYWLNESITEERAGNMLGVSEEDQSYSKSRKLKKIFFEALGVNTGDVEAWYETEGDDSGVRQELEEKYPKFFPALEFIEQLKLDGLKRSNNFVIYGDLEEIGTEDFEELGDRVKQFAAAN